MKERVDNILRQVIVTGVEIRKTFGGGAVEFSFIDKDHVHDITPYYTKEKRIKENNAKPQPERIIFNNPATIVFWADGTKTIAKCSPDDTFSEDVGFAVCLMKKMYEFSKRGKEYKFLQRALKRAVRK